MSSVTQVKFEVKPSVRKKANSVNSNTRSIGNVATSDIKSEHSVTKINEITTDRKASGGNSSVKSATNLEPENTSAGIHRKLNLKENVGKTVEVTPSVEVREVVAASSNKNDKKCDVQSSMKVLDKSINEKPTTPAAAKEDRISAGKIRSDNIGQDKKTSSDGKVTAVKQTDVRQYPKVSVGNLDLDKKNIIQKDITDAKVLTEKKLEIKAPKDTGKTQPAIIHKTVVENDPSGTNSGKFISTSLKRPTQDANKSRVSLNVTGVMTQKVDKKLSINTNTLHDEKLSDVGIKDTKENIKEASDLASTGLLNNKVNIPNSSPEKKISNIEREKMLAVGLKEELLEKRNMMVKRTVQTMDQEKMINLEDEESADRKEVEINIGGKDDDSVVISEPADMIGELQKYLLKKFGPVVTSNIQENAEVEKFESHDPDKTVKLEKDTNSERKDGETISAAAVPNTTKGPISPHSFIPHPIFFKTSIKKDPGSKLHDQLLKELGSVLKKKDKNGEDGKTADKENENDDSNTESKKDDVKFPKRRVSAKGNKILGNKALLANLENQLQRTLNRNKIFQRQKLKVVDLETIEVADDDVPKSPVSDVEKNIESSTKSGAKLILDSEKRHLDEDHIPSAIKELDMTLKEHSDDSSQSPSRNRSHVMSESHVSSKRDSGIDSDDQELFVYAYENESGKTEGVVCKVGRRESARDSLGRPRKYITCINIVAEKALDTSLDEEGCPFTQEIADGGLPSASGSGLFFAEEDKPAHFNVEVGRRKGDLRVAVSGPNSIAKCSVDPQSDGSYTVTYIPVETGIFDVSVSWNGQDIPGSPYHPKVVDARKVRIIGGWQHFMDSNERVNLVVGERKQLPFDISEAGPGVLRADVKGPSRSIDVDIDKHTIGKAVVEFVPEEEGTHYIHLFWSDIPLVNSPFLGYAVQHTPDASKLILTGRGLKEAVVREEAEFIIDGSQAGKGKPDVVLSGVRAEVSVKVAPLGNGKFRCNYIPILPGAYLLHITWNGRQLRGSPYKVNVIGAFYPNRVAVTGVGAAILGKEMNVGIDTRKAGPGELTAYCMGPHQVAFCELEDNRDGTFRLGVKAQESGRHVLQIKYGGEHVQGSPFVFKVIAQPDASKVRVHGPGVEHGILATYVSRFIVETRGAGAGQLTVRIRGPKGAFQVEMYRDSQRDRTILCRFDPTECGLYIISVKWSGVDVPGSPFHVHILDTQEELEHVLNDVSYSLGTSHSHHGGSQHSSQPPRMVYSQWREKI